MIQRCYLDNIEKDLPNGVKDLQQELFYDDELKGIFYRVNGDLEFSGDGYDYIYDIVFNQGICAQVEFLLQMGDTYYKDYYEGIIHVPDITEINVSRGLLKTPIADNNLSSYVYNNAKVKAYINAATTKSGDTGVTAGALTGFQMFSPADGLATYAYTRDNVYKVDSCFEFLVDFVSDGQMTYSSPFFGAGGDGEGICCASAMHLANDSEKHPYMSFEELFTNLDKIYNLSIYIDYSGALPEMIIDKTDNIYTDTILMTFSNVNDLKVNFDRQRFFSSIDIGSKITQSGNNGTFTMPDANFLGFEEEKYYIQGQCNLDRTLNLVNDFIIDSNSIQDMLDNQNDSNDETVVLIQSDLPANNRATKNTNIAGSGYVYNLLFNNYNKSLNYLGAIPNDMVLYISNDANGAQATKAGVYALSTGTIIHPTEVYDPANNYNNATGRFTCPAGNEGAYSFSFAFTGLQYSGTLGAAAGILKIQHYNSGGTLLNEITLNSFTHTIVVLGIGGFTGVFSLETGDYVLLVGVSGTSTTYFGSSTYTMSYIDVEGGTYQTYDSNDYKVMNLSFETSLTYAEFENIKTNIIQKVKVVSGLKTFYGWVKSVKRNIVTGMSEIILRTSNNRREN